MIIIPFFSSHHRHLLLPLNWKDLWSAIPHGQFSLYVAPSPFNPFSFSCCLTWQCLLRILDGSRNERCVLRVRIKHYVPIFLWGFWFFSSELLKITSLTKRSELSVKIRSQSFSFIAEYEQKSIKGSDLSKKTCWDLRGRAIIFFRIWKDNKPWDAKNALPMTH